MSRCPLSWQQANVGVEGRCCYLGHSQDRQCIYDIISAFPVFLATAKVLKFPEVQMHEILSDFARMIPAALDNVKNSLPTDFPENVVTAVETNVLRLHGRLSREYGIK